jgi:hypothetical protein
MTTSEARLDEAAAYLSRAIQILEDVAPRLYLDPTATNRARLYAAQQLLDETIVRIRDGELSGWRVE